MKFTARKPVGSGSGRACRRVDGESSNLIPCPLAVGASGRGPSLLSLRLAVAFPALILFDIDGTLVRRAGPHHRDALAEGIRLVTGLETTTEGIPVQGMLDPDILSIMLRRAGVSRTAILQALPEIQRAAERYYLRVCPEIHGKRCPSVTMLLDRLTRRGHLLGLVTGNLTRIGWHKLDRAGLRPYFRFGAFGEMAATRGGLARIAIREARSKGWIGRKTPISLIGDSPNDVIAARDSGIRSIAVRTGITPPGELEAERPDFLLRTLRDLRLRMVEEREIVESAQIKPTQGRA
jgi:phosphoglycolate phosphatase